MNVETPGGLSLAGREALVIGGSSGLGAIASRFLIASACNVSITGRSKELPWMDALPPHERGRVQYHPLVLATGEEFRKLGTALSPGESPLSILIYAVGPIICRRLTETEPEELGLLMHTNVVGFHSAVRAVLPRFSRDGYGRIVVFTAAGVELLSAKRMAPAYFAAKTALLALARSLARELAPQGITVNAIAPGWFAEGEMEPPDGAAEPQIPAGRAGNEQDLLAALSFLLAPSSSYFTGNNLTVSGGYAV